MITLSILGSTGSIGRSTLDIVRAHPARFRVLALAAGKNGHFVGDSAVVVMRKTDTANQVFSRLGCNPLTHKPLRASFCQPINRAAVRRLAPQHPVELA